MVFASQDAWRKHPFISGLWRRPLPGMRLGATIFGALLVAEQAYNFATEETHEPEPMLVYHKPAEPHEPVVLAELKPHWGDGEERPILGGSSGGHH